MMRHPITFKSVRLAGLVAAGLALGAPAWANIPVPPQITGQVSAVEGTTAVTINGTTYLIAANSPAYQAIQSVNVGDTIGLILSGPAGVSTSQVVAIVTGTTAASSAGAGSGTSSAGSSTSSR
jgi:hypothetical protein